MSYQLPADCEGERVAFRSCLERHGLTLMEWALAFGLDRTTVASWGTKRRPFPAWAITAADMLDKFELMANEVRRIAKSKRFVRDETSNGTRATESAGASASES